MSTTDFDSPLSQPTQYEVKTIGQVLSSFIHIPVITIIGVIAVGMVAFLNHIDLEAENDKVGLNLQVMVKLAFLGIGGMYGFYGFLVDPRIRRVVFSFPVLWMVGIFACFLMAVPGSPTPKESLASALSIPCVILMTVTATVWIGSYVILETLFLAISAFVMLSWLAFAFVPSIGVFYEDLPGGEQVARMGGLSHPNTLGQFAALGVVVAATLFRAFGKISWWRGLVVLACLAALVASLSRTSFVAMVFSIAVLYRDKLVNNRTMNMIVGIGFVTAIGVFLACLALDLGDVIASKLSFLSKSGDTSELTSGTGRTEIWAYVIELISEQPVTGYGAATSKIFLADYSYYTHNLVLNIAFSAGVFAGAMALMMCLGRVREVITSFHPIADGLAVFIVINGLAENVIFSILCGLPTVVWTFALCARRAGEVDKVEHGNRLSITLDRRDRVS